MNITNLFTAVSSHPLLLISDCESSGMLNSSHSLFLQVACGFKSNVCRRMGFVACWVCRIIGFVAFYGAVAIVGFVAVYKNCSKTQLMENLRNNAILLGDKIEKIKLVCFGSFVREFRVSY